MAEENQTPEIEDDPIEVRRAKREALIAAGENPYGHAFDYTHHTADLEASYGELEDGQTTEDAVRVAGRIVAKRVQGKVSFFTLRDATGEIQLFCRINVLGEDAYAALKDLDVGDWIGACGCVMKTRRGQLSVAVETFELLSKSLRPLPEKFHGLADKEIRYRQRYVDLIANPEVKDVFEKRFKIVSACRRYMEEQGFYEVETPFLHSIIGGANAKPFITHFNALDRDYYLRIATELPLKRLLVGGFERVYEIGRQFRNEGMDPYHNPEFTTMEAYQAFTDLEGMKRLTQGGTTSITYQGHEIELGGEWRSASMIELASEGAGEDVSFDRSREELVDILERNGGHAEDAWGKGKLISEIFEAVAEEKLIQPTFVCAHPLEISPLAKKDPDNPELTQRFELFICGHEYANAFNELNDPVDQAERFHAQVAAKDMGDDEAMGYPRVRHAPCRRRRHRHRPPRHAAHRQRVDPRCPAFPAHEGRSVKETAFAGKAGRARALIHSQRPISCKAIPTAHEIGRCACVSRCFGGQNSAILIHNPQSHARRISNCTRLRVVSELHG